MSDLKMVTSLAQRDRMANNRFRAREVPPPVRSEVRSLRRLMVTVSVAILAGQALSTLVVLLASK